MPFQSITKRDKRARHVIPYFPTVITFHVKHATQHLHQNCLCTLTSSYRHLASNYTSLLNDSTPYTICWPGVESSYTSICLSFGNSLCVTAMVEHKPLRPNIFTYRTLQMRIVPHLYTFLYIRFQKPIVIYLYRPSLERETP